MKFGRNVKNVAVIVLDSHKDVIVFFRPVMSVTVLAILRREWNVVPIFVKLYIYLAVDVMVIEIVDTENAYNAFFVPFCDEINSIGRVGVEDVAQLFFVFLVKQYLIPTYCVPSFNMGFTLVWSVKPIFLLYELFPPMSS